MLNDHLKIALFLSLSFATIQTAVAQSRDCNAPTPDPIVHVALPGHPFGSVATADGCWIFVTVGSSNPRSANGVAVLRRGGGAIELQRVAPVEPGATKLVMTHDGKLLIAADDEFVTFLDVARLISGQGDPILGYFSDARFAGSVYVNVTRDDKLLFVSDENVETITVIDLMKARAGNFQADSILGKIPVGNAPIALTFSPDEKLLYTTSQLAPKSLNWPKSCKPEGQDPATAKIEYPFGAVIVVDVAKAAVDPAKSVVASVPAGCSPVRAVLSPEGATLYVTARNSDALLALSTAKMLSDPEHAITGTVPVGRSPVGVTVADAGKKVLVTNSNRFAAGPNDKQNLTVIDAAKVSSGAAAILGVIPAGGFPREFGATVDGKVIFVANYTTNTLEVIDVGRMHVQTSATGAK